MILSKRFFVFSGIVLIILGIVICAGLIMEQYLHCVDMWHSEKSRIYDSVWEYFCNVSEAAVVSSVLLGSIPATIGILLCKNAERLAWWLLLWKKH